MNTFKIAIILILLLVIYSCSSKNKVENLCILSEKQIKFKKTLEDMKEILDCNNLPFFLYHGTALGAHREKKFIEHNCVKVVMPEHNSKIGNPVILPKSYFNTLKNLKDDFGARSRIRKKDIITLETGFGTIFDIDTKDELAKTNY